MPQTRYLLALLIVISGQLTAQKLYPVKSGNLWGLMDGKGQLVVPARYEAITEMDNNQLAIVQSNGLLGFVNRAGQATAPPSFDRLNKIGRYFYTGRRQNQWTLINHLGKVFCEAPFERAEEIDSLYVRLYCPDGERIAHRDKGLLNQACFFDANVAPLGFVVVKTPNARQGLFNPDGVQILDTIASGINVVNQDIVIFKKDNAYGAINRNGRALVKPDWKKVSWLWGESFLLDNGKSTELWDASQQKTLAKNYDNFALMGQKIICIKNNKYGVLTLDGKEVITPQYDEIQPFSDTIWRTRNKDVWGLVAEGNRVVMEQVYDYIGAPDRSVAMLKQDTLYGIINTRGEFVLPLMPGEFKLNNNTVRQSLRGKVAIIPFNEDGYPLEAENYTNVRTIKVRTGSIQLDRNNTLLNAALASGDSLVLENFEWVYFPLEELYGLRDRRSGKMKIPPTYSSVKIYRDLGFTVACIHTNGESRYGFGEGDVRLLNIYTIISNAVGVPIVGPELLDLRMSDIYNKKLPVARVIFSNGKHGLISKKGKVIVRDYAFIGEFSSGLAKASAKGVLYSESRDTLFNMGLTAQYLSELDCGYYFPGDFPPGEQRVLRGVVKVEKGVWGYLDTLGKAAIGFQYDYLSDFQHDRSLVRKNGKWGAIDTKGAYVLAAVYDYLEFLPNSNNELFRIEQLSPLYGMIDAAGQVALHVEYEKIRPFKNGLAAVCKKGKWGFADLQGKEVVPCKFEKAGDFQEGLAAVRLNRKWGYIHANGEFAIQPLFSDGGDFNDGLAWVRQGAAYGYIDKTGSMVIPPQFQMAQDFKDGYAVVKLDMAEGMINKDGKVVLKPKYRHLEPFDENGLAVAKDMDGKCFFLNKLGEKVSRDKFDKIMPFTNGFAAVLRDNRWGYVNTAGQLVVPTQYISAGDFSCGRALVRNADGYGYLDTKGNLLNTPRYISALDFCDNAAVVQVAWNKYGLLDTSGAYLIKPECFGIKFQSEGLVLTHDKAWLMRFVDSHGAQVINEAFQNAKPFRNGLAPVKSGGKWCLINRNGFFLFPPKYSEIYPQTDGYSIVQTNRFYGVADLNGQVLLRPEYEYISYAGDKLFRVEKNDEMGYLNEKGEWVFR